MAATKQKMKTKSDGVGDEQTPVGFTPDELNILANAFRERGGFQTSPSLFVQRVEEEEEGRTESVLMMLELVDAFEDAGFVTVKQASQYVVMAKKLDNKTARVVKIFNGSKRRIRWKTVRLG